MATVATQMPGAMPKLDFVPSVKPNFTPIIDTSSNGHKAAKSSFDTSKHLNFTSPTEVVKMTDLGFAEDAGVSKVAVSQPFRLFSKEAIHQMRNEILNKEVMEKCKFSSNIAACQIRGYSPK